MKRHTVRKMVLRRETLLRLTDSALANAAGGATDTTPTDSCGQHGGVCEWTNYGSDCDPIKQ